MVGGPDQQRFAALDGLRGWAALSVAIYHCLWQTFEVRVPETHNFIAAIAGNGIVAVGVFLTISGYVLTWKRWRNPANPPLYIAALRRYLRLTIPIVAATALVFALVVLDLTPTREAHQVTRVAEWYRGFVRFEATVPDAVAFALWWAYTWPVAHNYNPFLWTMVAELWGSFALFSLSQTDRYLRESYSVLLLLVAIGLLTFPLAACFIVGALIALAERDGVLPKEGDALTSFVASTALVALLVVGACVLMIEREVRTFAVVGTGIFLAARYSRSAHKVLTLRVSLFLGRISFPLYLVQFAVIVSFSAHVIIAANAGGVLNGTTAVLIAAASVGVSVVVATLLLPAERAALWVVRRFDRWRSTQQTPSAATA